LDGKQNVALDQFKALIWPAQDIGATGAEHRCQISTGRLT